MKGVAGRFSARRIVYRRWRANRATAPCSHHKNQNSHDGSKRLCFCGFVVGQGALNAVVHAPCVQIGTKAPVDRLRLVVSVKPLAQFFTLLRREFSDRRFDVLHCIHSHCSLTYSRSSPLRLPPFSRLASSLKGKVSRQKLPPMKSRLAASQNGSRSFSSHSMLAGPTPRASPAPVKGPNVLYAREGQDTGAIS